ncbi:MAG: hypothetical protein V2A79_19675 [Planctomycetota bacterium]
MTRIITVILLVGGAWLGATPAAALAYGGGCSPTVYNNYGDAAYYITNNNVSYADNDVRYYPRNDYVPANYPANFAYPVVAPAAYGAVYREPVYVQPTYVQRAYYEPVYVSPAPVVIRPRSWFGFSFGYHREVYRSRQVVHREVAVRHAPVVRAGHYPAYSRGYARPGPVHGYSRGPERGSHSGGGRHRR